MIGGLFFGHSSWACSTSARERLVVGIAAQAAVAMDNARLYEQAQRAADERKRCSKASARRAPKPSAASA